MSHFHTDYNILQFSKPKGRTEVLMYFHVGELINTRSNLVDLFLFP